MDISAEEIIKQYIDTISHKYPHIPPEEIRHLCRHPFKFAATSMASPDFPTIKFKYFGYLSVFPQRVTNLMSKMKTAYKKGRISKKVFLQRIEWYQGILNKLDPPTVANIPPKELNIIDE